MGERVKVAFASGSEDLIPTLLEKLAAIYPELPLHVVSEFPPPVVEGVKTAKWVPWYPAKDWAENWERVQAAFGGMDVALAAVILQPNMPYWGMRWAALRGWPWQWMAFNENLDHFMLRPRSLPVMARHFWWRTKNFVRWETKPGGTVYTFLWRVGHPRAFLRPIWYWLASLNGWLAARLHPDGERVVVREKLADGVSVVIPSRNGRELLERLFASFEGQWPEEVIVSDNGSTDGTAEWVRERFACVVLEESAEALSFAAAVNIGIRKARFSHVCLLNNDMVVEPGFFAALRAKFDGREDLFAATAQIFFPEGVRREETGKAMYHAPGKETPVGQFPLWCEMPFEGEDGTWVLYGSGGCTLYDTAKLRALGGIGEQFRPAYVEDLDIGWRAWRQGWGTVFAAGARVEHRHRATTSRYYSEAELEEALERNYLRFVAGCGSPRLWREALERWNRMAAKQEPVEAAERALRAACGEVWQQKRAAAGDDAVLALCGGGVAVFPGRAVTPGRPAIVVAAPYLPFPLSHGGAVRMFNLMREAAREFDQVLIVFADELRTPARELLEICAEIVVVRRRGTHLLPSSDRPDVVEEHDTPEFRAAFAAVLRKWRPGIVQLEFTQMGLYADLCGGAKTVLVEHDITLDLYGQLLREREDYDTRRQWEKWERFERDIWGRVDTVVAMSEKDRQTVGRENGVALLNGVDLGRFQPLESAGDARRLLFIGSFAHLPNVMALEWFLREVWGLLAGRGYTLHVIAGQWHDYFLAHYADRVQVNLEREGVEVEGFVSDVRGAYGRAGIVIAPLVASAGTNIKIMEAMAMERAIVTTPAGINGLELFDGLEVAVAATGEEMAAAIERLAGDESARRAMAARARVAAVERYGWEQIGRKQAAMYRSLLGLETIH